MNTLTIDQPPSMEPIPLIVAEDASATFGGEAVLPLHYFRRLRDKGIPTHLIVHARNRDALLKLFPDEAERMHFVPDTRLHKFLWAINSRLPFVVARSLTGPLLNLITQLYLRHLARRVVRQHAINVVHQPTPVSPKSASLMYGLGVPVILGPLNGGMSFPAGFKHYESLAGRCLVRVARWASELVHRVFPGKLRAHTLLVANARTREALPLGIRGRVEVLVENGVDLKLWRSREEPESSLSEDRCVRFVFAGRLVDWKGVDLLLRAVAIVKDQIPMQLELLGDGSERPKLERLSRELGITDILQFHGWLPQSEIAGRLRRADVFVLPSLWECGGAVVLEAMAAGVPVIATAWGGPADYLDAQTGILVPPSTPEQFPKDLAHAMLCLAKDPARRQALATAALERVTSDFDWDKKIDRILEVYQTALRDYALDRALRT